MISCVSSLLSAGPPAQPNVSAPQVTANTMDLVNMAFS
jgi:hypothetical protein